MNRNGLGSKRAKSISSTQAGKRRVADIGPDRIIRSYGANDIRGWYDSTQPELSTIETMPISQLGLTKVPMDKTSHKLQQITSHTTFTAG